ncbi:MAG: hypothetical protein IJM30_06075 [Thermoguttaceae bacterium]|nr:hypothetical protein [Thermoguttaceae bacterium]
MAKAKPKKEKAPKAPKAPKAKKEKKGKSVEITSSSEGFSDDSFAPSPVGKRAPKAKAPRVRAPKDAYTLVLLISFLIFIAATVFMYLDLNSYK